MKLQIYNLFNGGAFGDAGFQARSFTRHYRSAASGAFLVAQYAEALSEKKLKDLKIMALTLYMILKVIFHHFTLHLKSIN